MLNLTGRFLFALPFMITCIFYFRSGADTLEAMPQWMPGGGVVWVYLSAVVFAFASVSILVLKQVKIACYLLAGVLIITAAIIHMPNIGNEAIATISAAFLMKDLSLAGAALLFATMLQPRAGRHQRKL